ncbi:MAG: phasin family protein [Burkholderiales bacterium]
MYAVPEQFAAANKASVQALIDYTSLAVQSVERLADFQFQSSRAAVAETLANVRVLSGIKDVQEFNKVATSLTQPVVDRSTAYAKHVQALLGDVQGDFTKFFDTQVAEYNKRLSALLEQTAQSAPAGSDVAVAALKTAITAANQAYDAATKAGKQFTDMAEASVQAATASPRKKAA